MSIAGIGIDASNRNPMILLRDPSQRRQVPILIDHGQAHNIMAGIERANPLHPLSHDLMMSLLKAGGLHLEKVIIHAIEEASFRAVLRIRLAEEPPQKSRVKESDSLIELDARPSDAIALAVRANCKIWMLEEVVALASIPVDTMADEEDQNKFHQFLKDINPTSLIKHLESRQSTSKDSFDLNDEEQDS